MDETAWPAARFEQHRDRLRAVAYRMLGSAAEADDALQESWLRISRSDAAEVDNPVAWLTTVVARVCLNMLRSREHRREEPLSAYAPDLAAPSDGVGDPEHEAELADAVGLAMLVVLDTLAPAERLAFVLHDMFAVPFDEIGAMIERTPTAARQLASRARRRVKGQGGTAKPADLARQRRVVDAYLAAARDGDFDSLLALLDPDVVLRADRAVMGTAERVELRGVSVVAKGAYAAAARTVFTETALVDGVPGLVMAPRGRLAVVLAFTIVGDVVTEIDVIADPERLRELRIAVFDA